MATEPQTLVPDMGRPGRKGNTLDNILTLGGFERFAEWGLIRHKDM